VTGVVQRLKAFFDPCLFQRPSKAVQILGTIRTEELLFECKHEGAESAISGIEKPDESFFGSGGA